MIAVLFDFNGVLVDDEDVHFEAFRRILEVLGVTISHEVYRRYLGFDDRGTIVALLPDGGWKYLSAGTFERDLEEMEDDLEGGVHWW